MQLFLNQRGRNCIRFWRAKCQRGKHFNNRKSNHKSKYLLPHMHPGVGSSSHISFIFYVLWMVEKNSLTNRSDTSFHLCSLVKLFPITADHEHITDGHRQCIRTRKSEYTLQYGVDKPSEILQIFQYGPILRPWRPWIQQISGEDEVIQILTNDDGYSMAAWSSHVND